jgi:CRP-like cAMP-binding protein
MKDASAMLDLDLRHLERELFLAAFGASVEDFDPWLLDRLTLLLEEAHVRAGQILWSEGQPVESLYFIREGGRIRMTRDGAAPWTFEGRWLLGSFDGHFDQGPRRTAVALADFHAFKISRVAWLDLLEDSFELLLQSVLRSAGVVAELEQRVSTIDQIPPSAMPLLIRPDGTLDAMERLAILIELGTARGAGIQALADIAAVSHERIAGEGEVLFRAGDDRTDLLLVVSGEVDAARRDPPLERRYARGELVTGAAAFTDSGRDWEARARTAARLLAIPIESWFDLIEEHFDLGRSILIAFATRRELLLDRLAEQAGPEGIVLT